MTEVRAVSQFATVDPAQPRIGESLSFLRGVWLPRKGDRVIINPLNGDPLYEVDQRDYVDFEGFRARLACCPSYGLHNPLRNPDRYTMLGRVFAQASAALQCPAIQEFFVELIHRVLPKSKAQCRAEVVVTARGLANLSEDQIRMMVRGFIQPGNHFGQQSIGYRWPFGAVVIIAPFNFPLEIPLLQLVGALAMGNQVLIKADSKVSIVLEQALRLLHACGLPLTDVDLIQCSGAMMGDFVNDNADVIQLVQFTGSTNVAEFVSEAMDGRVRLEDAGFDVKLIGHDIQIKQLPYICWQSDQDAYAASGQKCSAESMAFVPRKLRNRYLQLRRQLARRRKLEDGTNCPVLTWNNQRMSEHVSALAAIPEARVVFGGKALTGHSVPECYGAFEPTLVEVPLSALFDTNTFKLVTTEVFGPVEVVIFYRPEETEQVIRSLELLPHRLTFACVTNDPKFRHKVLGRTNVGTTYAGFRARTTGAPQEIYFGPAGDPRAAGIGTPESILMTWSCHRGITLDEDGIPENWVIPEAT